MDATGAEKEVVKGNLPCMECGYNLRMQPVEGLCPECALPIAGTLERTITRIGSGPLQVLGRCAAWMAGLIVAFVADVILLVVLEVLGIVGPRGEVVFGFADLLLLGAYSAAVWRITAPSRAPLNMAASWPRTFGRACSAAAWLAVFSAQVGSALDEFGPGAIDMTTNIRLIAIGGSLACAGHLVALGRYLATLAHAGGFHNVAAIGLWGSRGASFGLLIYVAGLAGEAVTLSMHWGESSEMGAGLVMVAGVLVALAAGSICLVALIWFSRRMGSLARSVEGD